MDWLGQNWLWIALAIGAIFFVTRMGRGGMGGMGCSGGHRHHDDGRDTAPTAANNQIGNLFDPVSGHQFVADGTPISTVYRGQAYYFEAKQNRDTFEAEPEKYVAASAGAGAPVGSEHEQRQHHHGC